MNIAEYIGAFLLENQNCYLHAIGNWELKKQAASYNDEEGNVVPASYDVVFSKTDGSIDDSLANYIANIERVSLSNASNQIRVFIEESLVTMREGNEVSLPGLGKIFMDSTQEIQFEKDPNFQAQGKTIPFFKISEAAKRRKEGLNEIIETTEIKELKAGEEVVIKPATLNWSKILILIAIIAAVLGTAGYLVYQFVNKSNEVQQEVEQVVEGETVQVETVIEEEEVVEEVAGHTGDWNVLLNVYPSEERADARSKQLNSYGHNTSIKTQGAGEFGVIISVENTGQTEEEVLKEMSSLFGVNAKMSR